MGRIFLPTILFVVMALTTSGQGAAPNTGSGYLPNPRIVEHPQDGFLAKGQPATLNCKAKGDPKPVVTWYRNGQLVLTYPEDPTSHRMIISDGKLFFLSVIHTKKDKSDVGTYYCNATNIHGSAISQNATLRIAVMRDDFRLSPTDVPAAVGDTATFRCQPPMGKPEPKVLWRKGSEIIQGDSRIQVKDNGDLVISSVMVSDAGQYTCLAKNLAGEKASIPATLKVLEKPSFRKFPVDITTPEGETVEFPCDVIGDDPLEVDWKKEGGYIQHGRMRQLRDHTLRIENVSSSDAGVFICVAKNKVGTAEAVARLIVQYLPRFQIKPKDKIVGVGRTVTMQCSVEGVPPPTIIWSKQAREPTREKTLMFPNFAEGRYSVASDGTLRINRVQLEDSGKYECEALSGLGSAKATAILEVRESDPRPPPIIRFGPQNQTLPTNDNSLLHCEAVGDPVPTIRWFKNGNTIPIDPRILQLGSGTLQISDVQKSDSGIYTCKASSETGETSRSAKLTVESPSGNVPFRRIQNVKSFPGPPSKPVISDIKSTMVTLSWQPNSNQGDSDVYAYIVEYFSHETSDGWIVASDSVSRSPYVVKNLQPSTSYIFLIRSKNSNGIGAPSDLSDSVITADVSSKQFLPDPQSGSTDKLTRQEIRRRLGGIVVDLKAVDSLPSSARVIWKVYKEMDLIDWFEIEYTEILDMSKSTMGRTYYQNVSRDARSFTLKSLRSLQWYNICVRAYHGDIATQCSSKFKVRPLDHVQVAPPRDVVLRETGDNAVQLQWFAPVDMGHSSGPIRGYDIKCVSTDDKHNCSRTVPGNITMVTIPNLRPDSTYSIMVAARTSSGRGEWSKTITFGPEQASLMKEPWFIGVLIGVVGGTVWLALCVFSVWLCRKRRNRKKQKMQEMYSVPNFNSLQKTEEGNRNSYSYRNGYSYKDAQTGSSSMTPMAPEFANLLDNKDMDGQNQNIYNVPQMKTFYYAKDPVAPYATTTLINAGTLPGRSAQGMEHVFRPIPQNSGSGDSCCKHECSGDSNTDNSRPNTGIPHDHNDHMQSPTSDSGSHTTDENGFLLKKGKKPMKQVIQPKQAMVNWAEFLPPPPEHPPPGGDTDLQHSSACQHYNSGNSSGSQQYAEINCLNREACNRSPPMSPMSKISSCSCPVPHNATPVSAYNMPAYSDTGCARCCSPKYCDNMSGPYGPHQFMGGVRVGAQSPRGQGSEWGNIRAQSPRGPEYPRGNDTWGQRTIDCVNSRGTPVEVKCRSCHSDHEQGSLPQLQNYKIIHPPNDFQNCQMYPRESEYQFLSDNERGGSQVYPCVSNNLGRMGHCDHRGQEGQCMDRACQSSLPSVASECIHPPLYNNRQELVLGNQPMNIAIDGYHRNADSPVSDMGADYAGESTEAGETTEGDSPTPDKGQGHVDDNDVSGGEPLATLTDQCNSEESCDESESGNSSDGSFLNEADFASAVAKAAELSGLTVEGTTISDPKAKQQVRRQRRHHRPRPTSPYSTDSNFSEVVRKPYPKSQRKKQLAEQGGKRASRKEQNPPQYQHLYPKPGDEPPSYYRPNFPVQDQSRPKPRLPALSPTSKDSGINMETSTRDYLKQSGTVKV